MKFIIFLISNFAFAASVDVDSVSLKRTEFTYKDFCLFNQAKSPMLITSTAPNIIECLDQKFKINEFCIKKLALGSKFTRGYGNDHDQKVFCEVAEAVTLTINCEERSALCKNANDSCEKLRASYAHSLEQAHASILNNKLKCYYSH